MTFRPVWLLAALLVATLLHAAAFVIFSQREQHGQAESGNEGILVSLGSPAEIGAGGESEADSEADPEPDEATETEPEQPPPEPTPTETSLRENPDGDTVEPEDAGETPQNVVQPVPPEEAGVPANLVQPDQQVPEQQEPDQQILDQQEPEQAPEQDVAQPDQEQPVTDPGNAPPAETEIAAIPLPEFRPPRPDQPARRSEPPAPASRSSGAAASGNSNTENSNAQTGGGNRAEQVDYFSRLHAKLVSAKRYPRAARQAGIEGVAQIRLTVNRAGRITAFRITRSTGNQMLDQEINAMVARVQPLPRMPASMTESQITINMAVRFKLN